jgi:hypothetical protein
LWQIDTTRKTQEEKHRPLIFICHSLGGLVVQKALTLDPNVRGRRQIQDSTTVVIFLGTPHGGSKLANTFATLSFITDSPKSLLKFLSIGSPAREEVTNTFKEYYLREYKTPIVPLNGKDLSHIRKTPRSIATWLDPYQLR